MQEFVSGITVQPDKTVEHVKKVFRIFKVEQVEFFLVVHAEILQEFGDVFFERVTVGKFFRYLCSFVILLRQ